MAGPVAVAVVAARPPAAYPVSITAKKRTNLQATERRTQPHRQVEKVNNVRHKNISLAIAFRAPIAPLRK